MCESLFAGTGVELTFAYGHNPWRFDSAEHWVAFLETAYGPTVKARERLTGEGTLGRLPRRARRDGGAPQRGDGRDAPAARPSTSSPWAASWADPSRATIVALVTTAALVLAACGSDGSGTVTITPEDAMTGIECAAQVQLVAEPVPGDAPSSA